MFQCPKFAAKTETPKGPYSHNRMRLSWKIKETGETQLAQTRGLAFFEKHSKWLI